MIGEKKVDTSYGKERSLISYSGRFLVDDPVWEAARGC